MSEQLKDAASPIPVTAAVCGLYCAACTLYIATHEEPERLPALAARWGYPVEKMLCDGCRAETRSPYCQTCDLCACAAKRGLSFCIECADYPCKALDDFRLQAPHRAEIYKSLERIRDAGVAAWLEEIPGRYRCPACGTINSAYHLKCRTCGREPASDFGSAHRQEILDRLKSLA